MYTIVEIPKKLLAEGSLEKLLGHFGLIHGKKAYPEALSLSEEDIEFLKQQVYQRLKRELGTKGARVNYGFYWLDLGPSSEFSCALKEGWGILDKSKSKTAAEIFVDVLEQADEEEDRE